MSIVMFSTGETDEIQENLVYTLYSPIIIITYIINKLKIQQILLILKEIINYSIQKAILNIGEFIPVYHVIQIKIIMKTIHNYSYIIKQV